MLPLTGSSWRAGTDMSAEVSGTVICLAKLMGPQRKYKVYAMAVEAMAV
jgi:hypothetical protein